MFFTREWRNWQTRRIQVPVSNLACVGSNPVSRTTMGTLLNQKEYPPVFLQCILSFIFLSIFYTENNFIQKENAAIGSVFFSCNIFYLAFYNKHGAF